MVRAELEARGLQVFADLGRDPRRAAASWRYALAERSRAARAAEPAAEPTRIVLRPARPSTTRGFTVTPRRRRLRRARRQARALGAADRLRQRRGRRLPRRPARAARRRGRRWSRLGAEPGPTVTIGDWTLRLGADRAERSTAACAARTPLRGSDARGSDLRRAERRPTRAADGDDGTLTDARARSPRRRVVVKVGSSSLTTRRRAASTATGVDALVDALAALRAGGREVVLVSSGAIAAGLRPARPGRAGRATSPRCRPRRRSGRALLVHRYADAFARHGLHRRAGAADRRRRRPPRALPQRPPDARPAARARRRAGRQRERRRRHRRDPLRRQRPAGRAGRPPRPRRRARAALRRRRRSTTRDPRRAGRRAGSPRCAAPTTSPGVDARRGRVGGVGTGGMATQGRRRPDRHRRSGVPSCWRARADAAAAARRRGRRHATSTRPARRTAARLLWLAHATTPRGRLLPRRRRGARRSSSGGCRCCPPA